MPEGQPQAGSYGKGAAVLSVGIGVTGLITYAYFALASHSLSESDYGGITLLWSAVFVTVSVLYRPVEQLLSRTIADRAARGGTGNSHLRVAATIQLALGIAFAVAALALRPLGGQLLVVEVDPDDPPVAEPLRPLVRQHALAAADVEHRFRRRLVPELVERAVEGGHQPAHDRVGRAVLVEGVAGRDRVGAGRPGCRDAGHAPTRSPALPVARPASAPVVGGCWPSAAPGS